MPEQNLGVLDVVEHRLGHAVVYQGQHQRKLFRVRRAAIGDLQGVDNAALDALDFFQAAVVNDIGRLAGPGRNRPRAGHDDQIATGDGRIPRRRSIAQQLLQQRLLFAVEPLFQCIDMQKNGVDPGHFRHALADLVKQLLAAKFG